MSSTTLASPVLTKPARKPKGEGHLRRGEILAAAERIFVEYGYEGATIRKIADEVGVSSTALYMHFRDKSEILLEICRESFERLIEGVMELALSDMPVRDRIRAMMKSYIAFGLENPNSYRLIYLTRPQEANEGASDVARDLGGPLFRQFMDTVAQYAEAYPLTVSHRAATEILWAGIHGLVSLYITKPYFEWSDPAALQDQMVDTLLSGLHKA
ncbi:MAG: TetR/AcrR family transcriptional regulator [Asticcacaulis sp.]